jgi:hypothetical protein
MRCMVIVKANKDSEAGVMPSQELLTAMGKYNEQLVKAGVMLAGDGPFAETKESIAGYWIWRVKSMDVAVECLKRSPFGEGAELEIRPIFEAEDFGPALTPEMRESEARMRKQLEKQK